MYDRKEAQTAFVAKQAGLWHGVELEEERSPDDYAFVSSAAKETAAAARRSLASLSCRSHGTSRYHQSQSIEPGDNVFVNAMSQYHPL